jgi:YesN/AraC family two-component response regulator
MRNVSLSLSASRTKPNALYTHGHDSDSAARQRTLGASNILVVDDDLGVRETFELLLRARRYHVQTAGTGGEGLAVLKGAAMDMVLLDLNLPDMSGLQFLHSMPANQARPDVIVITGYGTVRAAVEAIELGASNVLEKPVLDNELLAAVEAVLGKRSSFATKAHELLSTDFADARLSVARLSRVLGVSQRTLSRQFRETFGCSILFHLHRTRIDASQKLLRDHALSVKEIATLVGYSRTSRFDLHFKRLVGTTPLESRNKPKARKEQLPC